jgi:hypothetical protein
MPLMPSHAFVAQALHSVGADTEWEDAPLEEQKTHMQLARVAIGAIVSWQRTHKIDGADRYYVAPTKADDQQGYALYDRIIGFNKELGVIYDALLAQQIIDSLNNKHGMNLPIQPKGPIHGE